MAATCPGTTAVSGQSHSGTPGTRQAWSVPAAALRERRRPPRAAHPARAERGHDLLDTRPLGTARRHDYDGPTGLDRGDRPVHQVSRRVRLGDESRQFTDLQRDLEPRAVIDPARDHRQPDSVPVLLERRQAVELEVDLRRECLRHAGELLSRRRVVAQLRENERARTERVDIGLGRGYRVLVPGLER